MPTRKPLVLDELDHTLLDELQKDADRKLRELGEIVGLSPSAVLRRVERYRRSGLLARQVAVLDPGRVPEVVLATCLITVERESPEHRRKFCRRLREHPQVQQAYDVTGEWDYVVLLVASGMPHMNELIHSVFLKDGNVRKLTTLVVFEALKTGSSIPTRLR